MTQKQFIEEIAKYVQKYAPQYNLLCNSAIIAQACLESGYGTSNKVVSAEGVYRHNYFGLKYRKNRVTCHCGYFTEGGSEQNADGSYTPGNFDWYKFESLEKGVEGYCQFVTRGPYKSQGIADPQTYLQSLKDGGYASSLLYVQNNMKVISYWNLTQYDTKNEDVKVSNDSTNSPLVTYTNISPHKSSPRNHKIDTITIHCIVGQWTAKQGCDYFAKTDRSASANYIVGKDGSIGLSVSEADRAWTSSNKDNDNRAVTIEVASDTTAPYAVTDEALSALIKLCADICKRNKIEKLLWKGDSSLIGQIDKQNMTVHRWFAKKACPGEYLYERHGYIAEEVNKLLGATTTPKVEPNIATPTPVADLAPTSTEQKYYRVQVGAYAQLSNANAMRDKIKSLGLSAIIKQYGNLYKVQIGAYRNKSNAEDMRDKIISLGINAIITYC